MAPVVLILGNGANIGSSVARLFLRNGYKVVTVSRSVKSEQTQDMNQINFSADLSDPTVVSDIFQKTKAAVGIPHVIIYNASRTSLTEKNDALSLSLDDVKQDLAVNTISAYEAAKEAVKAFGSVSGAASRTFIYTGNVLNTTTMPGFVSLGIGKSATAHMIESAAAAYASRGYKFYYCDERKPTGAPAFLDIDGDAHAELYLDLARTESQADWHQTFVKSVGYKKF